MQEYRDFIDVAEQTGVPSEPQERRNAIAVLLTVSQEIRNCLWSPSLRCEASGLSQRAVELADRIDDAEREREVELAIAFSMGANHSALSNNEEADDE
jgi:hypothetical protein